jgi:hypothetical protein
MGTRALLNTDHRQQSRRSQPVKRRRKSDPSLDVSPEQLDGLGRGEYARDDSDDPGYCSRNPHENPEQAYRRGVQQGAHRVLVALEEAHALNQMTLKKLQHFVGITLFDFRYPYRKGRRLGRRLGRDDPPWLVLKNKVT